MLITRGPRTKRKNGILDEYVASSPRNTGTLLPPLFGVTRPRTLNPLAWHTFHQKFINAITRIIGLLSQTRETRYRGSMALSNHRY